jgi:hypothetical protein
VIARFSKNGGVRKGVKFEPQMTQLLKDMLTKNMQLEKMDLNDLTFLLFAQM